VESNVQPDAGRERGDAALFAGLRARDPKAREALVRRYLPLARQLAQRYRRADEPFDDLMQVASLGLVKAVDRFDPDRGLAFSTFAVPTITGELRRYFRDRTWAVRPPRALQELTLDVDRAVSTLTARHGRSPSVSDIAEATNRSEEEVLEALEARTAHRATSLQAPRGDDDDDGGTLGDAIGGEDAGFELAEHRATIGELVGELSDRDREVLRLRFEEDLTQSEIGAIIGVSQMQVSRIVRQSLATRHAAAGRQTPVG
jgi:RNA polymerase sigma-B factor